MKKLISWLAARPADRLLHFIAGALAAAFFALALPAAAPLCILPALLAGVGKEAWDQHAYGGWDWIDLACTAGGGAVIQIFAWL